MTDCVIIGVNDMAVERYYKMIKAMGIDTGAFQDIDLAVIEHNGKVYRALDILSYFNGLNNSNGKRQLHNLDFLWPAVTYLGSYIYKRGYSFDYINLFHFEQEKLKEKLIKGDILSIAITTTLYVSIEPIKEIVSFIKKYNKTVKIIIGGPFIYNQTKANNKKNIQILFNYIGADFYVIGNEGEQCLVNILKSLKNGNRLDNIPNISYKNGREYLFTKESEEINSMEELVIDYNLFSKKDIGDSLSIRTAKSCPFHCAYCSFPLRSDNYKYLDVDTIEKQLDNIHNLGTVKSITFIDDTYNFPKDRFKDILRMMIRNKYDFKWNSYFRCDHSDEETIHLMKEANCQGVFLGVESGSDLMLKKMNKSVRRNDFLKYIPLLKQAGIMTHANVFIGFPGETSETVQETITLIEEVQPDFFRAQLWYCDPITPIYKKKEEYGIRGSAFNWSHNTMDWKTACNIIEKMFLSIENSIWLPQYGFEKWSIYYLQRKGMTLDQVKMFIKNFNLLIKEKLNNKNKKEVNSALIENLKQSCRFISIS